MAAHLSYFLWASTPDEELLKLASESKLHDEAILRQQVRRMLRDPGPAAWQMGLPPSGWAFRPLGTTIRPDARLFPEFKDDLAEAMREETVQFIHAIMREDHSVLEIIDSNYTFLNEPLAAHYKIDGIKGTQMQRVKLDDTSARRRPGTGEHLDGDVVSHRTSPVLRGKFILEELLGTEVPPPPPDVPVLNERRRGESEAQTIRQMLEKHRSKPEWRWLS